MNTNSVQTTISLLNVVTCVAFCGTGCMAHRNSYKVDGHRVDLRLLTLHDLQVYATNTWPDDIERATNFNERLKEVGLQSASGATPQTTFLALVVAAPIIAAGASVVAGLALDYTRAKLEEEAGKHEVQFTAWVNSPNFW